MKQVREAWSTAWSAVRTGFGLLIDGIRTLAPQVKALVSELIGEVREAFRTGSKGDNRMRIVGIVLLAVGVIALLNVAWPIVFIALGLSILIGARVERSDEGMWVRFALPKIRWDRKSKQTETTPAAEPPAPEAPASGTA